MFNPSCYIFKNSALCDETLALPVNCLFSPPLYCFSQSFPKVRHVLWGGFIFYRWNKPFSCPVHLALVSTCILGAPTCLSIQGYHWTFIGPSACASPTFRVLVIITNASNSYVRGSVHLPTHFLIYHPVCRVIRHLFNGCFLLSMLPGPQGHEDGFASPDLSSARGSRAGHRIQEVFLGRPSSVWKAMTLANIEWVQELSPVSGSMESLYVGYLDLRVKLSTERPESSHLPYWYPCIFVRVPRMWLMTGDWFPKQETKCGAAGLHNKPMGKMLLFLSCLNTKPQPSSIAPISFLTLKTCRLFKWVFLNIRAIGWKFPLITFYFSWKVLWPSNFCNSVSRVVTCVSVLLL